VLLRLLCPKSFITVNTLFVLCSSIIALQCRSVWKCIRRSLGLPKFLAIRFLARWKFRLAVSLLYGNMVVLVCGSVEIIKANLLDIFIDLAVLPFSGLLIAKVLASVSRSVHLICRASPYLAAVSLRVCRNVDKVCLHPLTSWSISVSRGMKTIFSIYG